MSQVVSFERVNSIQGISRINRQRSISVFGNLGEGQSQAQVMAQIRDLSVKHLPAGYSFGLEGVASGFQETFRSLSMALWLGVLVAYMILAVQFNSFIHPITILVALPFSVSGAFLLLWAFGFSLNLYSFIGILVLMGIVKKNSILLVEFTNQVREHEVDVKKALLQACPVRLRPILMTSLATIFAAFALIIGNDIGIETRRPLGITIIGGMTVSTIFSLFVVPALYYLLSSIERKKSVL
jgi:multidrug efflux pump subunit AcrB